MLVAAMFVSTTNGLKVFAVINCVVALLHGSFVFLPLDLIGIAIGYVLGKSLILSSRLTRAAESKKR